MKTWVIKIGTSILRGTKETSTEEVIETLSRSFTNFLSEGNKLILVTSGAVGLGCQKLNIKTRPNDLSTLQATAAVGQVNLVLGFDALYLYLKFNSFAIFAILFFDGLLLIRYNEKNFLDSLIQFFTVFGIIFDFRFTSVPSTSSNKELIPFLCNSD